MYPAYPYHNNPIPIPYAPNANPTAKETDRGIPNLPYYPWPSGCNHCYSIPQSCCNHSYFGGPYSFTPHYPHYPPPPPSPPFHTHGFYPPFTGAAIAHHPAYSFPPPHYSTEQPRYDYDKNTPTAHHCCGCEKKSTIKPQEPEVDTKTSEPLVPFLKDCPYPVMWVPSSYMNTQSNAKEKEKENHSHDPVLKLLEPSKKGENDERAHDQQGEGSNRFPFPIFWLPSKNNEVKKDTKEEKLDEKTKNDEAESFPIFWLPSKNNEVDMKEENNLDEKKRKKDEAESEKSSKNGVQKVIPVKQLGTPQKDQEKSSSQKTSKLPPVCLRIDPLPKKKNSSRSPSPSGDKKRSKVSTIEDSKACNKQETQSASEALKKDSKKVEKDNVVDEGTKMEKRKKLSENEAALMIQAVYRGFEVRKSQPLMKLRQIGEVGKQVVELRNRIQELETSSIDGKQKLVIGETLMSLLLKLDTIQGLHPVVRDVRKSVAKEVVGLQEKLDSLTIVKESETQSKQKTTSADEDQTPTQPESVEQASEPLNNDVAVNLQRQLELQNEDNTGELNSDQMELDQPVDHEKAQSDSNDETVRLDLDDHEAEAANPTLDMKTEYPVDQSSGELNNDRVQMAVETEQPVDDVIQEKFDQAQAQPGETVESDECERDGSTEARDMNLEPQVESEGKQSLVEITGDQLETVDEIEPLVEGEKSDLVLENVDSNEVDGGEKHSIVELTGDQTEMVEEKEKSDPREALILKNVDNMEDPATGTVEVETDFGAVETMELGKEDVDQEEATVVDDVDGGCKEVLIEDLEGDPPLSATRSHVSSGSDMKVMEENEKLRVAVEELMKAGNEQVSVIKELTGRVKDLEKKLSKKKRKVKRSSRRPRGSIVEEVCVV